MKIKNLSIADLDASKLLSRDFKNPVTIKWPQVSTTNGAIFDKNFGADIPVPATKVVLAAPPISSYAESQSSFPEPVSNLNLMLDGYTSAQPFPDQKFGFLNYSLRSSTPLPWLDFLDRTSRFVRVMNIRAFCGSCLEKTFVEYSKNPSTLAFNYKLPISYFSNHYLLNHLYNFVFIAKNLFTKDKAYERVNSESVVDAVEHWMKSEGAKCGNPGHSNDYVSIDINNSVMSEIMFSTDNFLRLYGHFHPVMVSWYPVNSYLDQSYFLTTKRMSYNPYSPIEVQNFTFPVRTHDIPDDVISLGRLTHHINTEKIEKLKHIPNLYEYLTSKNLRGKSNTVISAPIHVVNDYSYFEPFVSTFLEHPNSINSEYVANFNRSFSGYNALIPCDVGIPVITFDEYDLDDFFTFTLPDFKDILLTSSPRQLKLFYLLAGYTSKVFREVSTRLHFPNLPELISTETVYSRYREGGETTKILPDYSHSTGSFTFNSVPTNATDDSIILIFQSLTAMIIQFIEANEDEKDHEERRDFINLLECLFRKNHEPISDYLDSFTDDDGQEVFILGSYMTQSPLWRNAPSYIYEDQLNQLTLMIQNNRFETVSSSFPFLKFIRNVTQSINLSTDPQDSEGTISSLVSQFSNFINDKDNFSIFSQGVSFVLIDNWLILSSPDHQLAMFQADDRIFEMFSKLLAINSPRELYDDDYLYQFLKFFDKNQLYHFATNISLFSVTSTFLLKLIVNLATKGVAKLTDYLGDINKFARLSYLMKNTLSINALPTKRNEIDFLRLDYITNTEIQPLLTFDKGRSYIVDVSDMVDVLQDFDSHTIYSAGSSNVIEKFILLPGFTKGSPFKKLFLVFSIRPFVSMPLWNVSAYELIQLLTGAPFSKIDLSSYFSFSIYDLAQIGVNFLTGLTSAGPLPFIGKLATGLMAAALPIITYLFNNADKLSVPQIITNYLEKNGSIPNYIFLYTDSDSLIGKPSYFFGPILNLISQVPSVLGSVATQIGASALLGSLTSLTYRKLELRAQWREINSQKATNSLLTLGEAYDGLTANRPIPMREFKSFVGNNGFNPHTKANILAFVFGYAAKNIAENSSAFVKAASNLVKSKVDESIDSFQALNNSILSSFSKQLQAAVSDYRQNFSLFGDDLKSEIKLLESRLSSKNEQELALLNSGVHKSLETFKADLRIMRDQVSKQDTALGALSVASDQTSKALAKLVASLAIVQSTLALLRKDKTYDVITRMFPALSSYITHLIGKLNDKGLYDTHLSNDTVDSTRLEEIITDVDLTETYLLWLNEHRRDLSVDTLEKVNQYLENILSGRTHIHSAKQLQAELDGFL